MHDFNIAALAQTFLSSIRCGTGGGMQMWAIRQDAVADGLRAVSASREANSKIVSSRRGEPYGNGTHMRRIGSIAVVPIMGPLMDRMNSSYWSYDEIVRDLRIVAADQTIEAVAYDISSPGGMVSNVESAALEISKLAAIKPSVAIVGGVCASAALWLGAAAGRVVASPTSIIGSVGALISYLDLEGIFTRLGANKVEVLATQSPNKRLDPKSDEGQSELQAIVDSAAEMFLSGLQTSRHMSRDALMENFGQGLVFPAEEAKRRGMIDDIQSFEEALADLADRISEPESAGAASARNSQETIMANEKTGPQEKPVATETVTVEGLRAAHGDLVTNIEKDAAASGAESERARILGIEACSMPGHEALISEMKADGKTTPAEAAQKILAAVKASGSAAASVLEKMDKAAEGVVSTPSTAESSPQKLVANSPNAWRAEWEANDKLKAEYPTADSYVATMKREAATAA